VKVCAANPAIETLELHTPSPTKVHLTGVPVQKQQKHGLWSKIKSISVARRREAGKYFHDIL
jgi:hypothetical protein